MVSFIFFLGAIFLILVVGLSFFVFSGFNKSGAFECGFCSFSSAGVSFSMPFFVISLMFLLFDVEIVLMSFPAFMGQFMSSFWWVVLMVLLATCYEWGAGILSWLSSWDYWFRPDGK